MWPESNIQLKAVLPSEFDILAEFTNSLPGGATSPVHPFAGLVINFNVTTHIHRDSKDNSICLVMPLFDSSTTGGHLCILELGLVIAMKLLDVVIFHSATLSHFNLHHVSNRASFVFHSDGSGLWWVDDRNGWQNNLFMRANVGSK